MWPFHALWNISKELNVSHKKGHQGKKTSIDVHQECPNSLKLLLSVCLINCLRIFVIIVERNKNIGIVE